MLAPDTILQNRYRVVRLLGHGGMGAVFLAIDERLGHQIALKQMFYAQNEMLAQAFEREARILARLNHRCLPKVSDHFSEGEARYLVMQYIAGDDLGNLLERRGQPFSPAQVLNWADHLLDALEYLHRHEPPILHRDIKPQNLKINPQGELFLLDFGLAKDTATSFTNPQLPPSVVGYSLSYAPLEQIERQRTTVETDVYAVCATLYHLLTYQLPADALTRLRDKAEALPDPLIPVNQLNPQVSPQVAAILQRGLSFRREDRPQAAQLRSALKNPAEFQPAQMPPQIFQTGQANEAAKTMPFEFSGATANQATAPSITQPPSSVQQQRQTQAEFVHAIPTPSVRSRKSNFLPLFVLLLLLSVGAMLGGSYIVYRMLASRASELPPTPSPTAAPQTETTRETSVSLPANAADPKVAQNQSSETQNKSTVSEKTKAAEKQSAPQTPPSKTTTQKSNPPDKKTSGGKKSDSQPTIIP